MPHHLVLNLARKHQLKRTGCLTHIVPQDRQIKSLPKNWPVFNRYLEKIEPLAGQPAWLFFPE